ncbi:MAG: putative porin [Flavobacteriaceae bacterium]|nr:putative porin [Flavobacteriaceae bacterium]
MKPKNLFSFFFPLQVFLILISGTFCDAQIIKSRDKTIKADEDTLVVDSGEKDSLEIFKPSIEDYQYYTRFSEKKIFDTVFTLEKYYRFSQYYNRDIFGKIPFANVGTGFQPLVFKTDSEQNLSLLPANKSFGILKINDIKYYDVKTPTTSFIYHSAIQSGGALQSTYTQNVGKNFNFSVEYSGLRSGGLYQRSLAANNHTIFSAHFISKNSRYEAFAHFLDQNIRTEENGGITDVALFLGGDDRFDNRQNFEVNLNSSDSRFSYRRYYFSHQFALFNPEKFPFKIRHTIFHQGNKYYFSQSRLEEYYFENPSEVLEGMPLTTKKYSENMSNTADLLFDNEKFRLEAGVRHQNIKFGTNNIELTNNPFSPKIYNENRFGALGKLEIRLWNKFDLNAFAEFSNGKSFGNYLRLQNSASFEPIPNYKAEVFLNLQSAAPSFNFLLNNSPYIIYNYDFSRFKNQNILEVGGKLNLKFFDSQIFVNYYRIDNYAYFNPEAMPVQTASPLNISQIGGEATFSYGKFHLNSRLLFQSAVNNKDLFPMPNFIGRGSLYWQSKVFKNAAEIIGGINVYYFTKFDSRVFSPMLNEFILPGSNGYSIGGQPIADVYFNLKVKRMFFFIQGQHINATFMQNKSFTAPNYPIADFRVNIGIVWYLFH